MSGVSESFYETRNEIKWKGKDGIVTSYYFCY